MTKVVIIGAGIYGLVAAKTYLQLDPSVELTVYDSDSTVGGVWSARRLYPNLYAQITYPLFEFYDFEMRPEGLSRDGYISGQTIHRYLCDYATQFSLYRHIQFNTWVQSAVQLNDGRWKLTVTAQRNDTSDDAPITEPEIVVCDKLIVANGPTSKPRTPLVPKTNFSPTIIHSKDIGSYLEQMASPHVSRVVVVGAAKSAYDVTFLAMNMGKQVDWIIRPEGAGAMVMYPPRYLRLLNIMDLASTRLISKLSPSIMASTTDLWYRFFQKSYTGRGITKGVWWTITRLNNWYAGYSKSTNAENLRPTPDNAFWCNAGLGCMSVPGFWELFHQGKATVHRENIVSMQQNSIILSCGKSVETDFVVFATGWDDDISIFDSKTKRDLGLPDRSIAIDEASAQTRSPNDAKMETLFPLLKNPPPSSHHEHGQRSWALYRRVIPLPLAKRGDRSLVFLGQIHSISTMMLAGIQALWAVQYLRGQLLLPEADELEKEVEDWNAWTRRRYLTVGKKFPYSIYDFLPYIDALCRDMGAKTQRKETAWKDIFYPYGPRDYRTIVEEVVKKRA